MVGDGQDWDTRDFGVFGMLRPLTTELTGCGRFLIYLVAGCDGLPMVSLAMRLL